MKRITFILGLTMAFFLFSSQSCETTKKQEPVSSSGVKKATVDVETNSDGYTNEQGNIVNRYDKDDDVGAIKHLYVISAYSGDVIIYSTVKGKVTSSGKRLTPVTVHGESTYTGINENYVSIGDKRFVTDEMIQDDGTYGSSIQYLYWFDTKGIFHKHYVSGGQILHISDQPLVVGKIIINMELTENE